MAVLIPSLSASVSRMTTGERRLAERLEQKLDSDYLLWYDVPVGPTRSHPDFIVLHPLRGLLILEVKDWRLETIQPRRAVSENGRRRNAGHCHHRSIAGDGADQRGAVREATKRPS